MENSLIERYLYAVSKEVPEKIRKDVEEELRSLIMDMAEERSPGGDVTEDIILAVLEELGNPSDIAGKYQPQENRTLISAPYYNDYIYILKLVLACVGIGVAVSWMIGFSSLDSFTIESSYEEIVKLLASMLNTACGAFTIVTIMFAVLQRKGIAMDIVRIKKIADLPSVPEEDESIKKSDIITQSVFSILFTTLVLAMPERIGFIKSATGEIEYLFFAEGIRSIWYLPVLMTVLALGAAIFALFEGRYTKRYAAVNLVTSVISYVLFCIFWLSGKVMNPVFLEELAIKIGFDKNLGTLFHNRWFLLIILFAVVLDNVITIGKAIKYDK